jgi:hypothetical protein
MRPWRGCNNRYNGNAGGYYYPLIQYAKRFYAFGFFDGFAF